MDDLHICAWFAIYYLGEYTVKYIFITFLSVGVAHTAWAEEAPAAATQSAKGAWLPKTKKLFIDNCIASNKGVEQDSMRIACTCIQKKVEPNYLPADLQSEEGKKVLSDNLQTCIRENKDNMMGVQGAWAKVVKKQWMKNCEGSRPEGVTADIMKKTCSCTLTLLEAKFDPKNQTGDDAQKFAEEKILSCYQQQVGQ